MSCFAGLQKEFSEADTQVLGISVDPFPSLGAWSKDLGLWFPLLSDWPRNEVSRAYGTFNEGRSVSNRITFVIDKRGIVRAVISDEQDMERHAREALEKVRELEGSKT
jgi:mycoredoxin-dependent peroxiredoxin